MDALTEIQPASQLEDEDVYDLIVDCQYFIAAINRVGREEYGDNDFYGTSYFVDPRGQFVGEVADDKTEELLIRDLDFDMIDEVRNQWAFYRDRRPDAYEGLVKP